MVYTKEKVTLVATVSRVLLRGSPFGHCEPSTMLWGSSSLALSSLSITPQKVMDENVHQYPCARPTAQLGSTHSTALLSQSTVQETNATAGAEATY